MPNFGFLAGLELTENLIYLFGWLKKFSFAGVWAESGNIQIVTNLCKCIQCRDAKENENYIKIVRHVEYVIGLENEYVFLLTFPWGQFWGGYVYTCTVQ